MLFPPDFLVTFKASRSFLDLGKAGVNEVRETIQQILQIHYSKVNKFITLYNGTLATRSEHG